MDNFGQLVEWIAESCKKQQGKTHSHERKVYWIEEEQYAKEALEVWNHAQEEYLPQDNIVRMLQNVNLRDYALALASGDPNKIQSVKDLLEMGEKPNGIEE